jgi:hypothetical protein
VTPTTDILIANADGQRLLIRPLTRSHAGLFDYEDGNWIDCEIELEVGAFRGAFRADLRSEEFQTLMEQMAGLSLSADDGTASFTTMEGQLAFTLTGDGSEQIRIGGEAIDAAGTGNRLQFAFILERSALADIGRSLEHLLTAFPVVGSPAS